MQPIEPRRPFFITSQTLLVLEGSPTKHQSIFSLRASRVSITFTVPSCAGPSSSLVIRNAILPLCFGFCLMNLSQAVTMQAIELFISAVPRPYKRPSSIVGSKGGCFQFSSGPVGTTSVWPAKAKRGPSLPRRAQRLSVSPKRKCSILKPILLSRSAIRGWQPISFGVTDGREIKSLASSSVSDMKILIKCSKTVSYLTKSRS